MRTIYFIVTVVLVTLNSFAQQKINKSSEHLKWWSDSKFGMFLHWGLYSQTGGDWKGKPYKGNEHFMIYEMGKNG